MMKTAPLQNLNASHPSFPLVSTNKNPESDSDGSVTVETIQKLAKPKMYKVILLNDDFTPMDFVVLVLQRFFNKTEQQATTVMLDVHQKGAGVAGIYTLEIAEMKCMQVNQFARQNKHPLKCNMEQE